MLVHTGMLACAEVGSGLEEKGVEQNKTSALTDSTIAALYRAEK